MVADLTLVWLGASTCEGVGKPSEHCSVGCKEMRGWEQELTLFVVTHSHFAYLIHLFIHVRAPLANVDRMLTNDFAATNHKWGHARTRWVARSAR